MRRAIVIFCWIVVIATGAFLRFEDLGKRPFHADEATGARITARRMESEGGRFDPKHYHGPVLHDMAALVCMARGEHGWLTMTKTTLRQPIAIAGTLLLLVPLLWRKRLGDAPVLLAAALLATSPLLVYYSRMFIHEMLLTLFGMLALGFLSHARLVAAGFLIGLMFATKESFAISMIAWTGAGVLVALENRESLDKKTLVAWWRANRKPVLIAMLAAAVTSFAFYTDGFTHPAGAVDAVRTFFVYETVAGHDKTSAYYFQLLGAPFKSGGMWWFGTPVLALAAAAFVSSFRKDAPARSTIRFTAYAALGHFAIYSVIAYKTPWLACLPWAHVCLLAGFAFAGFAKHGLPVKAALVLLTAAALATQIQQTRRATGRFAADERNPFAYVPTRGDVEALENWLRELRAVAPGGSLEPIAVIGGDYWPLPWYLRGSGRIGYWKSPDTDLTGFPAVFAMPEETDAVAKMLEHTHTPLPRGLRAGVPVHLFVRNDIWNRWREAGAR